MIDAPSVWWNPRTGSGVLVVVSRGESVGYVSGTRAGVVELRTRPEKKFLDIYPERHSQRAEDATRVLMDGAAPGGVSPIARVWLRKFSP